MTTVVHKSLPAVVLVHGSWHVPEHYRRFTDEVEHAGFRVYCPLLPSCDKSRHATADLVEDAGAVRDVLRPLLDKGEDVVLVMHSSGGAVGTEAARGFSKQERAAKRGAITHLVYMCAFMLQVGGSVAAASMPRPVPNPIAVNGTSFPQLAPESLFYADVEPEYARQLVSMLVPYCIRGRSNPITHPAWKFIPTTYIRAAQDNALPPHRQDAQIEAVQDAGVSLTVKRFDSSHSPFASMPLEVVRVVQDASL